MCHSNGFARGVRRWALVVLFVFLPVASAFAQAAGGAGQSAGEIIAKWSTSLTKLLTVLMGIGGLVSLTFSVYSLINGNKEAAKKMVFVFLGLAVGSALMMAVAKARPGVIGDGSGGFDEIKVFMRSVFQSLLALVGMITMSLNTVQMVKGDEQAYRKIFVWVIAISVGSAMLQAI